MATKLWTKTTSGNWATAANWTTNGEPGAGDDVLINNATGTYTVALNTNTASLNSVLLDYANATVTSTGTRSLNVNFSDTSLLTVNAGTFDFGTGALTTNANNVTVSGGTMTLTTSGSKLNVTAGNKVFTISGGTVSNTIEGQINIGTVTGAAKTTALGTGGTLKVEGGTLNTGTLAVSGGTFTLSSGSIDVVQTATFSGGTDTISGGTLTAGGVTIGTAVTHSGGTIVSDTSGITISSGGFITMSGSAVLNGTVGGIINAGTISGSGFVLGNLTGAGVVTATGGELQWTGNLTGTNTLQISNTGSLALVDAITLGLSKVEFLGSAGELQITTPNLFGGGTITGMTIGSGAGTKTTIIDFDGRNVTSAFFDNDTDQLTINFLQGGSTVFLTNDLSGAFANWDAGTDTVFLTDTVCYAAGTRILTADGEITVEDIREGDLVVVVDGGRRSVLPVKWVGVSPVNLAANPHPELVAPVRIAKGAFAENVPSRDLIVSPPHAIFVDGTLIPAKMLVNDMTITREIDRSAVTYYHIELERHAIILADNLPAESYLDTGNRSFFRNAPVTTLGASEYHVNEASQIWEEHACAPLTVAPNDVRPTWEALAERAESLGYARPVIETTTDADLHVVVNGRRINAVEISNRTYRFILPRGADTARLVSRATAPAALAAYTGDPRTLGVSIRSIAVKSGASVEVFSADHPALRDGWHTVETLGSAMWRWTNGNAALPVATGNQPVVLEIQIADTATYAIQEPAEADFRIAA